VPDFSVPSRSAGAPALTKREIRAVVLAARRSMSVDVRAAHDIGLCDRLTDLLNTRRPALVAAYAPVDGEPGGPGLPAALAAVAPLILPVVASGRTLDWAHYTGELASGPYGLAEPVGPRLGPSALRAADLIVAPALAVDRRGVRLGRGGGYYDRALATAPGVPVVVPLYPAELVPELPAEPHDRRVHAVVTPTTVLLLDGSGSDAALLALEDGECQDECQDGG
jgi:5-formyltetrahydrofolate cyclo-ligase